MMALRYHLLMASALFVSLSHRHMVPPIGSNLFCSYAVGL